MQKIKCTQCGAEIPVKTSVQIFSRGTSRAETLCMTCYYKRLSELQESGQWIEKEDNDGDTDQKD